MLSVKKRNMLGLVLTCVIATGIIMISMRVWEMDSSIPISLTGDGILGALLTKSIKTQGIKGLWFCWNIGAPEISALVDTPFLDLSYGLEVYLISLFVSNSNAIQYIQYILSYTFAAFTMYLLLNRLTERVFLKSFFSLAFALTPYHFVRGMGHLTLSRYHVVPIAIYLMLIIFEEDFSGIVPKRYVDTKWKTVVLYTGCLFLGMSNIYYAFFGLICMSVALIGKSIRRKQVSCVWKEAVLIYAVLLGVAIGLFPKLYYSFRHGFNQVAGVRLPLESEMYSLKIIQLLLPCGYNRFDFLADINASYTLNAVNVNENSSSSLGLIASVGFLISCGWVIYRLTKARDRRDVFSSRMSILSLIILTLVLYSMAGGFGTFVSYFITPEIRCLTRSSIYIACLSICVCCLSASMLSDQLKHPRQRACSGLALAMVAAFTLYSEIPVYQAGWQEDLKEDDRMLHAFFNQVENSLQTRAMVYELPFMDFPENGPIVGLSDYEPALGYVYTDNVRWSYGGMKGRNDAAKKLYKDQGMSNRFVKQIMDAGFTGVYIDTNGYEDEGEAVISFYSNKLGLTPIVSEDKWLYFYNLEGVTIDERTLLDGYDFVSDFAEENHAEADMDMIADVAIGLKGKSQAALDVLWSWVQESGVNDPNTMSNVEYVLYLYNKVIGRDEPNPEGWASSIDNGSMTRREVFNFFMTCDEFRAARGLSE